jgi:hypothetical protein
LEATESAVCVVRSEASATIAPTLVLIEFDIVEVLSFWSFEPLLQPE